MLGLSELEKGRLIAKIFLFRTIFRGSGWSFANDPDFQHVSDSASYWDDLNEKFYKKYKGIDKKHHEWADLILHKLPIVGPFGRQWEIDLTKNKYGEIKVPWTTLTNYPVQGTGADIMTVARVSFNNRLKRLNLPEIKLVSTVHDSIIVDAPSKYLDTIVTLFYEVFRDLPLNFKRLFNYDWVVPLACECKYGNNLKDTVKIKPEKDLTKV